MNQAKELTPAVESAVADPVQVVTPVTNGDNLSAASRQLASKLEEIVVFRTRFKEQC